MDVQQGNQGKGLTMFDGGGGEAAQAAEPGIETGRQQAGWGEDREGSASAAGQQLAVPAAPGALAIAGVDFDANPFALMDMNDADQKLGQMLPLRRIEYCASEDARGLVEGMFTDTMTRTQKPSIPCVLVALKFTRLLMGKFRPDAPRDDPSRTPICKSSDGKRRTADGTGSGAVEVEYKDGTKRELRVAIPSGQQCVACPYSQWTKGQKRPVCSEAYNLLLADLDDGGMPFMLNVWHTGIKPLRVFRNSLKTTALKLWKREDGVPPNLRIQFLLSTQKEKRYYLPVFANLKEYPADAGRRLAAGMEPMIAAFNSQDTTDVATQDLRPEDDDEVGEMAGAGAEVAAADTNPGNEPAMEAGNGASGNAAGNGSAQPAGGGQASGGEAPKTRKFGKRAA